MILSVFVLDRQGAAIMPCSEKRARLLLTRGRARVHRLVPFVIRLVDVKAQDCEVQPLRVSLNPASKATGIALVREQATGGVCVLGLFELVHRGRQISEALTARRNMRRRRRSANLRYRAPRFLNRGNQKKGWLAPSLKHRVDTALAWVRRIQQWAPVSALAVKLMRFDTQALQNPEISGIEYQQGTLLGYEVREYLLEKWGRKCAYCGAENVPLQIDHIHPRSKGGSNRVSNLTLACQCCNEKKAAQDVTDFLKHKPQVLQRILAQAKRPLKDEAAINATRWALVNALNNQTGLPVEWASGGQTKFNRARQQVPKSTALDAACVGTMSHIERWAQPVLQVRCMGRGSYQRTRLNKFGFPRGYLMRTKKAKGFQTGDLVRACVPAGKNQGTHKGRVAIRASGSFNIQTADGPVQGVSYRHCKLIQRGDGYGYFVQPKVAL